jgi:hypothetical protein
MSKNYVNWNIHFNSKFKVQKDGDCLREVYLGNKLDAMKVTHPAKMLLLQKVFYPLYYFRHKMIKFKRYIDRPKGHSFLKEFQGGNRTKPVLWGLYSELLDKNTIGLMEKFDLESFDYAERNFQELIRLSIIKDDYFVRLDLSESFREYIENRYHAAKMIEIGEFNVPAMIKESDLLYHNDIVVNNFINNEVPEFGEKILYSVYKNTGIDGDLWLKTEDQLQQLFDKEELESIKKAVDTFKHDLDQLISTTLKSLHNKEFYYDLNTNRYPVEKLFKPLIDFLTYFELEQTSNYKTTDLLKGNIRRLSESIKELQGHFITILDRSSRYLELEADMGDYEVMEGNVLVTDDNSEE